MNYKIVLNTGYLGYCGKAKNKRELREIILSNKDMQIIQSIIYGRKTYTMSDIYACR